MTPTEEAAKLARELAEAIRPVKPTQHRNIKNMVLAQQKEVVALFTPILTAAFAERDEELKRLREVEEWVGIALQSERALWAKGTTPTERSTGYRSALEMVRNKFIKCREAALQPKEPNNE